MSQLIAAVLMASALTFVVLNIMVGCQSWEDEACITPKEFVRIFVYDIPRDIAGVDDLRGSLN